MTSAAAPAAIEPTHEQRAVIDHPLRPLRVAAGAGTGKTTTMALRLARLVRDEGVAPEATLGITFTNKAAAELADAIRLRLGDLAAAGREVQVATYHGFAYDLLREFGAAVGVERHAQVVTPGYSRQLLRDALGAGSYAVLDLTSAPGRVDELAGLAGRLGDQLRTPADLSAHHADGGDDGVAAQRLELADTLERYERLKARLGVVDYTDLIRLAHELVSRRPELAALVRSRYRVVVLDEYQDTNPAQRELLLRIFGDGFPVTAVGDPDQTIYEWRGASLDNFASFPEHFAVPGEGPATTLGLRLNRRSDHAVLAAANLARARIDPDAAAGGDLVAGPGAGAGRVVAGWFRSALAEATWVASEVRRLHDAEGVAWADMAVLFRKNQQIGLVREALEAEGVPVEVAALGGLLGIPEVADLHAWLRILGRPDDAPALARVLFGSRFRLGLGDLAPLARWVRHHSPDRRDDDSGHQLTLLEAAYQLDECPDLGAEAAARLREFLAMYRGLLQEAQGVSLVELCRRILDRTGAWPEVEALDDAARLSARLNLYRFLDLAEEWSPLEGRPSLDAFLDYLDLLQEDRAAEELDTARLGGADAVALLTVHRAKGLEWPAVFLPALCEGTFPAAPIRFPDPHRFPQFLPEGLHLDASDPLPADETDRRDMLRAAHAAQEWRTAYVAVTRAKHRLYATGAFWYTEHQPKGRSELWELLAALPATEVAADVAAPGDAPPPPRVTPLTDPAPDPHFGEGGWQEALRATRADPGWPAREAARRGRSEPYHARVDQLRIMLDGLPEPPAAERATAAFATSVTGLVTYAQCPLRFRWSEVDRLPRRPSAAARRGVDVHRRIELHNRGAVALDEADDGFYDVAPGEESGGRPGTGAYEAFRESRFAAARPRLIEAPFDLALEAGRVRGRIDAVYEPEPGEWEIVDFKSGARRADAAARVQLEAYALAATEAGFAAEAPERLTVTFAYLGGGLEEVSEAVDGDWLTGARHHLETLLAGAAAGDFPPAPSAACAGCDFLRFCDAGQTWVEERP